MFDNKCYPADEAGLTLRRFGEDVKSMTVTGVPAGAPSPVYVLPHSLLCLDRLCMTGDFAWAGSHFTFGVGTMLAAGAGVM